VEFDAELLGGALDRLYNDACAEKQPRASRAYGMQNRTKK
jgi:hypothetical protein